MINIQHMNKTFHLKTGDVEALNDVSLNIEAGQIYGVIGYSGAGKSTLVRCINLLETPDSGSLTVGGSGEIVIQNGKPMVSGKALKEKQLGKLRRGIGMIFQHFNLLDRSTVFENIAYPLRYSGMKKEEIDKRVNELLATVEMIPEMGERYPHEMSGGQRQRLGIARALACNPEFIVCDEPISALDVSIQAQVINTLESLQEKLGLSYLFVSHDLSMVRHISHNVGVMYLGCMVERAPVQELYSNMLHPYTQALMSAVPIPDPDMAAASQRIHLTGDVPTPIDPPSGCRFRARCPYATEQCAAERPELREVAPDHFVACHRVN